MCKLNFIKRLLMRQPVPHINDDKSISKCAYITYKDCLIYRYKYIGEITNNIFNTKYVQSRKPVFDKAYFFNISCGGEKVELLDYNDETEIKPSNQLRITYIDYRAEILNDIDKFIYYRTGQRRSIYETYFIPNNYLSLASIEADRLNCNIFIDNKRF